MSDNPVVIADYNEAWPRQFHVEQDALSHLFVGTGALVEHVGSTAVPGLGAKPIIDIMLGVTDLALVESRIPQLATLGYEYVPEYEAQLPQRRYFRKSHSGTRVNHLHCVVDGSDFWRSQIIFRDYLRTHHTAASAYDLLKRCLAISHGRDRLGYTEAKGFFIQSVLRAATNGEPLFRSVSFGDPAYDGPYLRENRDAFDGPDRTHAQTDYLENALSLTSSVRILDAGCGIGTYTREFAKRGHQTVGLDLSATFLNEARQLAGSSSKDASSMRADCRSLPFAHAFDVVIMTGTPFFRDIGELRQVCRQVRFVLRPGGRFCFDYTNWRLRSESENTPRFESWSDGDALVIQRTDWDALSRKWSFEWVHLNRMGSVFLRSGGEATCLWPEEVLDTLHSSGYVDVELLAK